jgi:hypothetical protein
MRGRIPRTSNVNGGADATSALLNCHVPADKFGGVRAQIGKLSLRVENESTSAESGRAAHNRRVELFSSDFEIADRTIRIA